MVSTVKQYTGCMGLEQSKLVNLWQYLGSWSISINSISMVNHHLFKIIKISGGGYRYHLDVARPSPCHFSDPKSLLARARCLRAGDHDHQSTYWKLLAESGARRVDPNRELGMVHRPGDGGAPPFCLQIAVISAAKTRQVLQLSNALQLGSR